MKTQCPHCRQNYEVEPEHYGTTIPCHCGNPFSVSPPGGDEITPEDILFDCPACGHSLAIDRRGAGMEVPCPGCGKPVRVPPAPPDPPPIQPPQKTHPAPARAGYQTPPPLPNKPLPPRIPLDLPFWTKVQVVIDWTIAAHVAGINLCLFYAVLFIWLVAAFFVIFGIPALLLGR